MFGHFCRHQFPDTFVYFIISSCCYTHTHTLFESMEIDCVKGKGVTNSIENQSDTNVTRFPDWRFSTSKMFLFPGLGVD